MEYSEADGEITVEKGTGVAGFLKAVEGVLKLPRVQSIHIDSRGKVAYKYFVRKGEETPALKIDFESLKPFAAIRNGESIDELETPHPIAAIALGQLFDAAAADHLFPVAFASGIGTSFWSWAKATELVLSSREELFGIPFLTDQLIPDRSLVLGAAYARGAALVDIRKSYKLVIPKVAQ
jgi:hypothetical protein